MSVVVIGKNGQLAWELAQTQPSNLEVHFFDSKEIDVTNKSQVVEKLTEIKPSVVINASAYTAVDKAETDIDAAYAVNENGPKYLADFCKTIDARLIQISTDFVFDAKKNTPYEPSDQTNPLGVYGASKLAGEKAVLDSYPENSVIIRTSWVYSVHGNNFVKTMLRLMAEKPELGIVSDQVGSPTWAKSLAEACWAFAKNTETGIYHYSDLGVASWYDFSVAIQSEALNQGLLDKAISVKPIKAAAYPTPAMRPAYSVMNTDDTYKDLDMQGKHWQFALSEMLAELKSST